jgi:hypothetical protein
MLLPSVLKPQKGQTLGAKTQRERDYIDAIAAMYMDYDKVDHRTRVQNYLKAEEQIALRYPKDEEAQMARSRLMGSVTRRQDLRQPAHQRCSAVGAHFQAQAKPSWCRSLSHSSLRLSGDR